MDLTHYITLGRSGLRVSPLCLGAMTFGNEWGIGVEPEPSMALMDRYIDQGGNFIDTANMYNKGHSEAIMGDYFAPGGRKGGKRDRIVLATKWLGNMWPGDPNGGGGHRKAMLDSFNHSLRRLRTDYIDLLWMHFWDRLTPMDETMRTLDDLVRAGKVRYIGFSDTPAWKCAQAQVMAEWRGWTPLIALQIEYSLLERTVEGELMPMAAELGLGVTPWSPLKGGVLSGKYRRGQTPAGSRQKEDSKNLSEKAYAVVDALDGIAKSHNCTVAQAALAWVRQQAGVSSTIIGARSMEQLDANIASLGVTLSAADLAKLDELSKPTLNFPHDFLLFVRSGIQNGTTVNGVPSEPWKGAPQNDTERWYTPRDENDRTMTTEASAHILSPHFLKEHFNSGVPYEAYAATGNSQQVTSWKAIYDQARLTSPQREMIASWKRTMPVLVSSGVWCGDCVQQCPLLARIAEANPAHIHLRFVDRDVHKALAERVAICGGLRVPTAIFMAEDFEFISLLGDRTLTRYRAVAARQLGASCPVPGAPIADNELSATLQDWLDEFERVQLLLRLSGRLRQAHAD